MQNFLRTFWSEESGFVVSAELMLISTVGIIALVVGLSAVSHAVNNELRDVATAFSSVNQSWGWRGQGYNNTGNYNDNQNNDSATIVGGDA